MIRQSPLKALQTKSKDANPEDSLDGASPLPQSLSAAFGNSPEVTDGGPGQISPDVLDVVASGSRNGLQYEETNIAVTSTSILKKPKKVWAKKKLADNKAEKTKKRSSSKFK
ncbi:hypothetical protein OS493_022138 [Desmophyllum pertusum]|uniref:Uncharacterized protein n=1 Tax=Desmophyllum pertusum TaxID=174260 RepID=A0A9W9YMD9_9CNID|nr:hypothetical protein OS493_022138 [Desmophyllum pertusum]